MKYPNLFISFLVIFAIGIVCLAQYHSMYLASKTIPWYTSPAPFKIVSIEFNYGIQHSPFEEYDGKIALQSISIRRVI